MSIPSDIRAEIEALIPHLRRYAYALTRDHAAADDLVQDTLERALSRSHTKREEGELKAWLFAIERNLFLGGLRRQRRRGQHVPLDEPDLAPMRAMQETDLAAKDLLAAFARLPEESQSLLLLIGVEEMSYQQSATILGLPLGTIMSRLSRARAKLREMLESNPVTFLRRVK